MVSPPTTDLAVDLRHVAKIYKGRVHALQGIDLQVRKGEVFGLLGPNGAGKSTLVKIIMTVVRPTRAEGSILGSKVGTSRRWRALVTFPKTIASPVISRPGRPFA